MIRARRQEIVDPYSRKAAFLVHDELLFMWLVTLVWRQRNIRECQIGHNVFKAQIPVLVDIAVPRWAQERLSANPREEFWQFHFREDETKMHREVQSILPRRLVPLLDMYLENYRPLLLRGFDPTNLFLNRRGHPLDAHQFTNLVSNLTVRYGHRRVTPHVVRDIFAYSWLEHHPEDYLTLSKALWHKDIKTTLLIYGCKFDESHGLRRVEEWLDSRGAAEDITQATTEGSDDLCTRIGEGHKPYYKAEYEAQRKINPQLTDRIAQLEKQLGQRAHDTPSQTAQQGRNSIFRKKGSGGIAA
jgi:hypothetical protein